MNLPISEKLQFVTRQIEPKKIRNLIWKTSVVVKMGRPYKHFDIKNEYYIWLKSIASWVFKS